MSTTTVDHLNVLLADYQVLYQKFRNYHWNVKGPQFFALHPEFEKHYLDFAIKADGVAERIAALGARPPSTFAEYLEHARVEEDRTVPDAMTMVSNLIADLNGHLAHHREISARDATDQATRNLLETFGDEIEKSVWMLKAFQG